MISKEKSDTTTLAFIKRQKGRERRIWVRP
jgi:hypothetical protein